MWLSLVMLGLSLALFTAPRIPLLCKKASLNCAGCNSVVWLIQVGIRGRRGGGPAAVRAGRLFVVDNERGQIETPFPDFSFHSPPHLVETGLFSMTVITIRYNPGVYLCHFQFLWFTLNSFRTESETLKNFNFMWMLKMCRKFKKLLI